LAFGDHLVCEMHGLPDSLASTQVVWLLYSCKFWQASVHWLPHWCMLSAEQSSLFSLFAFKLQV